jgi:hypothetical protein
MDGPTGHAHAALDARRIAPWRGRHDDTCALLLHSSDRPESRPFWRVLLLVVERHFPPLCSVFFSYNAADDAVREVLHGLVYQPSLIRRGSADDDWAGALRKDLPHLSAHRWVFHMMDDAIIPDPISPASVRAVLDAAEATNASTVALYPRALGFWRGPKNVRRLKLVHSVNVSSHVAGNARRSNQFNFYAASRSSRMVKQQNFALWQRDSLASALGTTAVASPGAWENAYDHLSPAERAATWPGIDHALALESSPHMDPLLGIEDLAHGGAVKAGFSACTWIRAAARLNLPLEELPGGGAFAGRPDYDFCTLTKAIGDGVHAVRSSPCGCFMNKTRVAVVGIYCKCWHSSNAPHQ